MSAPQSGADVLRRVRPTLAEQSTELCLRPDLLEKWQDASDALEETVVREANSGQRLGSAPSQRQRELAEAVQSIEAEIAEAAVTFTLRALPPHRWRALCDNHPPREGNQIDRVVGYNRDAVLDVAVRECLIDPAFEDCAEKDCDHEGCGSWQQFTISCNAGEWNELRQVANTVNLGVVEDPKSELASRILTRRASGS